MKKRELTLLLTIICLIAFPTISHAQIIDPNDVPIDGGLSLLVAAGAAYGIKKYKDSRKKGEEAEDGLK
jgi:hypothetical protein